MSFMDCTDRGSICPEDQTIARIAKIHKWKFRVSHHGIANFRNGSPEFQNLSSLITRVYLPDRSGQTGGVRFRYTGPVWPVTGRNRWNSNFAVQPVRTGIPVGWTGLPAGLTGNRPNSIFFFFGLNSNARKIY